MAEKKPEGGEAEQPPKKSNKLLIIIIAVLVVVLGGGGAFFMLKKGGSECNPEEEDCEAHATEPEAKPKKKAAKKAHADAPPVFVKLDPFTVKLSSDGQDAYLQATPELRVLDAHTGDNIKLYTPEIRHKLLLILAARKAPELATPKGVQMLSNEMRVAINEILEPPDPRAKKKKAELPEEISDIGEPEDPVQAVLFTSFIIQ